MRLFAKTGVLVAALVGRVALGQTVPPALAGQVAGIIAHQWASDSASLQLQWGFMRASDSFPAGTTVSLVGRGDGGWFSATFARRGAPMFAVRVRAGAEDSVMAAARAVDVGVPLTPTDIQQTHIVRWGPPVVHDAVQPRAGWVTRRALMIGEPITVSSAAPPPVVHNGDAVQLQWTRGGVVVGLEAVALGAAGVGQTVRVRLVERGGERNGIVIAPGIVKLES